MISGHISFPEQISETHERICFILHAHPLGGDDVPFGVYEILPNIW